MLANLVEGQPAGQSTYTAADDAYVKSSSPTGNYGSSSTVRLRESSKILHGYLQFAVSGIAATVQRATVRMHVADPSDSGGSIYLVSNDYRGGGLWDESGLTWSNAPEISGDALSSVAAVETGDWVEFDVTAAVTGNGTYSFALANGSKNAVDYS
jgi:hypothetical protein